MTASPGARLKSPGTRLKRLRVQRGMTTRQVADLSRLIADKEQRDEFELSHTRLLQIETGQSTPSIYKLFALSAIYGISLNDLLSYYMDPASTSRYHLEVASPNTHPIAADAPTADAAIDVPLALTPDASLGHTTLISELVSRWGQIPAVLLSRLNLRHGRYALIGLNDYTMYPLLRPGSFVQIEKPKSLKRVQPYANEYQRPIFFIEHREGYICSWCEVNGDRLLSIPHPLSPCRSRFFAYPRDADIVGVVTAIAVPLARPAGNGSGVLPVEMQHDVPRLVD